MRSLGIDIGRHSIKVVEILANNRNYEITNAKEFKILNMETSDQEIDIIQTLNTIAKEFDTETAKVTCSIRQQYVSTRKLFFPFKERAKIHKSLAFELEDKTKHRMLNEAVVKGVKRSAPFPEVPELIKGETFTFQVPVAFAIQ